jgi:membrane protein implicated in regulation of membrane protease activity
MPNLTWIESLFWASTVIGGVLFLLRLIFFAVGGDFGDQPDGDIDIDVEGDLDLSGGESDTSFRVLSLQSLTAFFMMFGLSGLTLNSTGIHEAWAILGSLAVGILTGYIISLLFSVMRRFQSEGTLRIENAVGQTGQVYLRIPATGSGQVRVSVQGRLKIFDAVSAQKDEIRTGESVTVVDVAGGRTLVVEKV